MYSLPSAPLASPPLSSPTILYPLIPYHTHPLPSHPLPYISSTLPYPSGRSRGEKSPSLPSSRLPYPALLCPPLPFTILPSSNPFLPSTPIHYLTLPYPPPLLSSFPLHYFTLPHSFPYPLLPSPILSHHPILSFYPSADVPTLQSPLPHPSHLSPSLHPLGYPIYPTLLSRPCPALPYYNLPSTTFTRIPYPTYLPAFPRTPVIPCIPYPPVPSYPSPLITSPPLSSPTLTCPLHYHIPPDSPAPTLLYSPFYYSSLASPPLPTYPRTPILPLHSLPSAPLACPPLSPTLPYHIHPDRSRGRNVSFSTSTLTLPYSTLPYRPNTPHPTLPIYFLPFHSSTLASHPLHSSTISSCTLPSPPLPSLLFSHLPLSHPLAYLTIHLFWSTLLYPKIQNKSKAKMFWYQNV